MESRFAGTIRSVFVFLVGALPAALITTYVILVGILSFGAFLGAPNMLLLFILPVILGIAGSLGTVALWAAVFQQTNGLMALGLVVGILAMAIVMPDDAFYFMFLPDWARRYVVVGPVLTAVLLEAEYITIKAKARFRRGESALR